MSVIHPHLERFRVKYWGKQSLLIKQKPVIRDPQPFEPDLRHVFDDGDTTIPNSAPALYLTDVPFVAGTSLILVRKAYEELYEYLGSSVSTLQTASTTMLLGSSGIGKTCFIAYAVIRRLIAGQPTAVSFDNISVVLFIQRGTFTIPVTQQALLDEYVDQFHGIFPWAFIDCDNYEGNSLLEGPGSPFTVLRTGTDGANRLAKREATHQVVMKPWTWPEIVMGRALHPDLRISSLNPSQRAVDERRLFAVYEECGPIPRLCYSASLNPNFERLYWHQLLTAVRKSQEAELIDACLYPGVAPLHISKLGYLAPSPLSISVPVYHFTSPQVMELLHETLDQRWRQEKSRDGRYMYNPRESGWEPYRLLYALEASGSPRAAQWLWRRMGGAAVGQMHTVLPRRVKQLESSTAKVFRATYDPEAQREHTNFGFKSRSQFSLSSLPADGIGEKLYFCDSIPACDAFLVHDDALLFYKFVLGPHCKVATNGLSEIIQHHPRSQRRLNIEEKLMYILVMPIEYAEKGLTCEVDAGWAEKLDLFVVDV